MREATGFICTSLNSGTAHRRCSVNIQLNNSMNEQMNEREKAIGEKKNELTTSRFHEANDQGSFLGTLQKFPT